MDSLEDSAAYYSRVPAFAQTSARLGWGASQRCNGMIRAPLSSVQEHGSDCDPSKGCNCCLSPGGCTARSGSAPWRQSTPGFPRSPLPPHQLDGTLRPAAPATSWPPWGSRETVISTKNRYRLVQNPLSPHAPNKRGPAQRSSEIPWMVGRSRGLTASLHPLFIHSLGDAGRYRQPLRQRS